MPVGREDRCAPCISQRGNGLRQHGECEAGFLQVLERSSPRRTFDTPSKPRQLASGLYEYVEPDYRIQAGVVTARDAAFTDGRLWGCATPGRTGAC
jgi:hypothetical protein